MKKSVSRKRVVKTQSAKLRQTGHRIAAANPEVKERIKKLKRTWKHSSPEAKRKVIVELLDDGCSIRGLDEDTGIPATTIRLHLRVKSEASQSARNVPERLPSGRNAREKRSASNQEKNEVPVELQGSTKTTFEARKPMHQAPPLSKPQTEQLMAKPAPARVGTPNQKSALSIKLPLKKIVVPRRPRPSQTIEDREETIASLRGKAEQLIVDRFRAECGTFDESTETAKITSVFQTAREFADRGRQGNKPVRLPPQLKIAELLEKTEPPPSDNEPKSAYVGRWIARIVNALNPNDQFQRDSAIDRAERQLLPSQKKETKTKPSDSSPRAVRPGVQIRHTRFSWDPRS